ncbi:MAG: tyrosine-type recombinase/integrase, partial [Actinomycetota bacterium]|nr:tyrosine-type recombinase/integrase [Actinomycetota bacterium]
VQGPPEPKRMATFHELAAQWWIDNARELAPKTQSDYKWRLQHLLPFFAEGPLDQITFDLVNEYKTGKLAEAEPLSARSINMTLTLLAAILEVAVENEVIPRNPAKGKRRRVRERAPRRTHLDRAEQIAALLAAGGALDARARLNRQHVSRRAVLATLIFAGLRIGELCALRWRDVDLASGWLTVTEAKTDAGRRKVKIRGALREELADVRAKTLADIARHKPRSREHQRLSKRLAPEAFVFATLTGARPGVDNVRNRVLAPAVKLASEQLVEDGSSPLPDGLSPHSLRRTFASVLYALGEDPGVVMDEMGHSDPGLSLAVYRQTMRRGEDEKAALRALVEGVELADEAVIGSPGLDIGVPRSERKAA